MRAIIFANGLLNYWPVGLKITSGLDFIIAADGGCRHCRQTRIIPDIVVGDMDSIEAPEIEWLKKNDVPINRYPVRKDHTDLELALMGALERKCDDIWILAAMGGRWDMTLSNALILAASFLDNVRVRIADGNQEISCLKGYRKADFNGCPGDMLSLIPVDGDAAGITLTGLEYPLNNAVLKLGTSRGISNLFTNENAVVELRSGCMFVIITRKSHPELVTSDVSYVGKNSGA